MTTATQYRESAIEHLPALSPMALRLIGKLSRTEVDLCEVSSLIEKDAVLCAQLLRAVNSASHARTSAVNRVRDAVVLMGTGNLRKIALSVSVTNFMGRSRMARGWSPLRFNLHSAAVAILADILAEQVTAPDAAAAFVTGLLHDIGKFAIAINLQAEYELILQLRSSSGKSIDECERDILGVDHAELSSLALLRWEMPGTLQRAVLYHHRPDDEGDDATGVHLSRIVHVADRFVHYLGISAEPPQLDPPLDGTLDLPGVDLPRADILARFEQKYKELSVLFH